MSANKTPSMTSVLKEKIIPTTAPSEKLIRAKENHTIHKKALTVSLFGVKNSKIFSMYFMPLHYHVETTM